MGRSAIFILSIASAITVSIVAAWWPRIDLAIALEDSPFAWLQSSVLVACSTTAGLRAVTAPEARARSGMAAWAMLSLFLVIAAIDERFMGHERIQEFLYYRLLDGDPALKHWSQTVTAAYGIAGIVALAWLRGALTSTAWRWCRAGVAAGLAAIALDIAVDSVPVQVVEEVIEVLAEVLFLCGLVTEVGSGANPRHRPP